MRLAKIIFVLLAVCIFMVACGGKKDKTPPGPEKVYEPSWYGKQDTSEYIYTYGYQEGVSQRAAESSATAMASAAAAQAVQSHVKTMTDDYISEAGVTNPEVLRLTEEVTRRVANATFSGAMVTNREPIILPNGRYKVFVQYAIPKDQIGKELVNRIASEEALYNRFKASQAFERLEFETKN